MLWPHKQPAAKQEKCRTDDDQSVPNGTYISPIFKNRYHHKVININDIISLQKFQTWLKFDF